VEHEVGSCSKKGKPYFEIGLETWNRKNKPQGMKNLYRTKRETPRGETEKVSHNNSS